MKKKISLLFVIIGCALITALIIGCPSNIQPGNYRLYTVNGIVTKADGETGIENILIEVRNQKVAEKDANVVMFFSSGDENLKVLHALGRGDDGEGEQNSSGDENPLDNSGDNSNSSGDDNSTDNSNDSSSSSGDENSTDQSSDTKKSSPDENPILNSCRTAADGKFTLTFKSYDSDTNLTFIIYATDDDGNENGGTFKAKSQTITFEKIENNEPANPYGTYQKSSKQYETEIKIKMN